ncbi:MAG: hypothetical protein IJW29_02205 [Clostridia bacterium]|nr:hypothetical protein [Clostridia bacterium]
MARLDIDGAAHELPKMTLKVKEAFRDATDRRKSEREQATALLKLMKDLLPDDYVAKRLGGKTVDSIDVVELAVLTEQVWDAYQSPIEEARNARAAAKLDEMQPTIDEVRGLMDAVEKANAHQSGTFKAMR